MQDLEHVEDSLHEEVNQEVNGILIDQEKIPMGVQSEDKEIPLFDEARAYTIQDLQEQSKEGVMSRGIKRKVVQLASIKHQGKTLSMLGEIGVGWSPKTKTKNKLRLNMKKLLKPKLAQEKITVIEDSSSQEELEENEDSNVKEMKGKKQVILEDKSALTETRISEMLKEVQRKVV